MSIAASDAKSFGSLLRRLRKARKLTQHELAAYASVAINTIQRAEAAEECVWRRSTAGDILVALQRVAPLSREDETLYAKLAGLEILVNVARALAADVRTTAEPASLEPTGPCESFGFLPEDAR